MAELKPDLPRCGLGNGHLPNSRVIFWDYFLLNFLFDVSEKGRLTGNCLGQHCLGSCSGDSAAEIPRLLLSVPVGLAGLCTDRTVTTLVAAPPSAS